MPNDVAVAQAGVQTGYETYAYDQRSLLSREIILYPLLKSIRRRNLAPQNTIFVTQ